MSRTTGEALREAILRGISEWWDRQDFGSCEVEDTSVVAAAIVEELGITREVVAALKAVFIPGNLDLSNDELVRGQRATCALIALLDCAEVEDG